MNWKLVSHLMTTVFIKLIGTSLLLFYFSQIFHKASNVTSKPNVPAKQKDCPIRWVPFDGKCYYFSAAENTWDESQQDCARSNSHLAVINNNAELMFILNRTQNANYFLGLTHSSVNKQWTWLDNTKFDLKQFQIFHMKHSDCALVGFKGFTSQSCSVSSRWICEENE
uniref:C-type lectin domain-containing protein n=1 Tax=Anolis carolinensis TaxID=28377 RepID=A0A803TR46_ANOCA|nr:PREDICTED: C-type lectin domain family 5 member A [Anolis carolinensis]|eukprot:XP_008114861.1 PREDICTED: C-type lectin domain family 5 member A [Anolis carolinensis]